MECDNNKYQETSNLIIILTNMIEILKIQHSFYVCVCVCVCVFVCRKHSYGQFNKNYLFTYVPMHTCWESLLNQCVHSWLK